MSRGFLQRVDIARGIQGGRSGGPRTRAKGMLVGVWVWVLTVFTRGLKVCLVQRVWSKSAGQAR